MKPMSRLSFHVYFLTPLIYNHIPLGRDASSSLPVLWATGWKLLIPLSSIISISTELYKELGGSREAQVGGLHSAVGAWTCRTPSARKQPPWQCRSLWATCFKTCVHVINFRACVYSSLVEL